MIKFSNLAIDLDGTLIDSSETILTALKKAIWDVTGSTHIGVTLNIIGPQLNTVLKNFFNIQDKFTLDRIILKFSDYYFKSCTNNLTAFPGVSSLLQCCQDRNINVYLVTNKCVKATGVILTYFHWNLYFKGVIGRTHNTRSESMKYKLISHLLNKYKISRDTLVYVGDHMEDLKACQMARVKFIAAAWGYDKSILHSDAEICKQPMDVMNHLI